MSAWGTVLMSVDWQAIVVSLIVGAALFYVARHLRNEWFGRGTGGCAKCSCRSEELSRHSDADRDGRRIQLGSVSVHTDPKSLS